MNTGIATDSKPLTQSHLVSTTSVLSGFRFSIQLLHRSNHAFQLSQRLQCKSRILCHHSVHPILLLQLLMLLSASMQVSLRQGCMPLRVQVLAVTVRARRRCKAALHKFNCSGTEALWQLPFPKFVRFIQSVSFNASHFVYRRLPKLYMSLERWEIRRDMSAHSASCILWKCTCSQWWSRVA